MQARPCAWCGVEFSPKKSRSVACGPSCLGKLKAKASGSLGQGLTEERHCVGCGGRFAATTKLQTYCAVACREKTRPIVKGHIPKGNACLKRVCTCCGTEFSTDKKRKTLCSNACKQRVYGARKKAATSVGPKPPRRCIDCAKPAIRSRCAPCGVLHDAKVRAANALKAAEKYRAARIAEAKVHECPDCGAQFCRLPVQGLPLVRCVGCAEVARKAAERAHRRIAKSVREARLRGRGRGDAYERVDPLKVLARDKWTCQLCGIKTPMKLRGTHKDNAPEVDHIIPLSKGGSHTYANLQCACRKCNQLKSDKPLGQQLLFG